MSGEGLTPRAARHYFAWKRVTDVCVSLIALIVLAPVMLVTAAAVRAFLGSPVLFRHRRTGYRGKDFVLLKFRTMRPAEAGKDDDDAARLTRFGSWLRSTSLDELPQLINVLRGEMSLVGPRPLLPEYLQHYTKEQARRLEVPPGITGWAQVNGRNNQSWDDRFRYDLWYVDNCSFWVDLKILGMTSLLVLRRKGIARPGHATMNRFTGQVEK